MIDTPDLIIDFRPCHRSAFSEDDDSDRSSESDSSTQFFFCDDSSAELEKTESEDDDDAKNERDLVDATREGMSGSHPTLRRSSH